MSVVITPNVLHEYTWADLDDKDWTWDIKTWASAELVDFSAAVSETVAADEQVGKVAVKPLPELLPLTESRRMQATLRRNYPVFLNDKAAKSAILPKPEAAWVTELGARWVAKALKDSFSVMEEPLTKAFLKALSEVAGWQEGYVDQMAFQLRINESFGLLDSSAHASTLALSEALTAVDAAAKRVTARQAEGFNATDSAARTANYIKKLAEAFGVAERRYMQGKISKAEAWSTVDRLVRNANAIIGDLQFFQDAFGEAQFLTKVQDAPAGFSAFKPFLAGEHTFSEALFKTTLTAAASLSRPRMNELVVTVDVPDVTEQGEATVPLGGTASVVFKKDFYATPTVKVVVSSGTELSIPRLSNETADGFDVKLESLNNPGTYVAGTIRWSAEGY